MAKTPKKPGVGKPRPTVTEGALTNALASLFQAAASSSTDEALDRAQILAFDAMEAPSSKRRTALAREALALSPLCADAHLILAQEEKELQKALPHYRQAVEAGAKALGEVALEEDAGHFWELIETRPYMRARHALAGALWEAGEQAEAVTHYEGMLHLNPNDNQGIRYMLADALLELGRDAEAATLLKRYKKDASAAWTWSGALLSFRQNGAAAASRKALARAVESNPYVADYLLARRPMPKISPEFIGMGDENEAIAYVEAADAAWLASNGAKAWVEAEVPRSLKAASPSAADGRLGPEGPAQPDPDKVDEAVLALLLLGLHEGDRVWKSFDWAALDRLHDKGFISEPASRAKSLVLSAEGLRAAQAAFAKLLGRDRAAES